MIIYWLLNRGDRVMKDKELAQINPAGVYKSPRELCADITLTKEEKIQILKSWSYDEREISVAEEENMQNYSNRENNILDEINKCLIELGIDSTQGSHPPTKQG
jgi:hypothetical protein